MLTKKSLVVFAAAVSGTIVLVGCGANSRVVTASAPSADQSSSPVAASTAVAISANAGGSAQSVAIEPPAPALKEINVVAAAQDVVRDGNSARRFSALIAKCSGVARPGPTDLADIEAQGAVAKTLFLDRDRITARGYHMLTDKSFAPTRDSGGTPSAEDQKVARCADALVSALAGVAESDYTPALAANVEILTAAATTVDLAAQRDGWTKCMAAGGFKVSVRGDSITSFLKSADPTDAERAQAVADYDCQGSSGLREGKRQWLAKQATEWLAKNRSWVDSLASSRAAYEAKLSELERTGWRG
jgi:hypothetical protein